MVVSRPESQDETTGGRGITGAVAGPCNFTKRVGPATPAGGGTDTR